MRGDDDVGERRATSNRRKTSRVRAARHEERPVEQGVVQNLQRVVVDELERGVRAGEPVEDLRAGLFIGVFVAAAEQRALPRRRRRRAGDRQSRRVGLVDHGPVGQREREGVVPAPAVGLEGDVDAGELRGKQAGPGRARVPGGELHSIGGREVMEREEEREREKEGVKAKSRREKNRRMLRSLKLPHLFSLFSFSLPPPLRGLRPRPQCSTMR